MYCGGKHHDRFSLGSGSLAAMATFEDRYRPNMEVWIYLFIYLFFYLFIYFSA